MTLAEIMTSSFRGGDVAKMQLIEEFDGHGGQYVVCHDTDVDWQQNGQRFRDLRTARAYASLGGATDMHVVGPDMTCYEPGFES